MIVVGITGAIASGKTTVASMFAEAGYPVLSADAVVHDLYAAAPRTILEAFPEAEANGRLDRAFLAAVIARDPGRISELEAIVHPLVEQRMAEFVEEQRERGMALAVVEVPLLYEAGTDAMCDAVITVDAPAEIREARVATRGGMSPELYHELQARQLAPEEKARRADFVVDSTADLPAVRRTVGDIIAKLIEPAQ